MADEALVDIDLVSDGRKGSTLDSETIGSLPPDWGLMMCSGVVDKRITL